MSPIAQTHPFRTALVAVVLAGVAFVTAAPSPAQAESGMQRIRTYFKAMDGLTTAIDNWNADVATVLSAAETKPEVFCSADFVDLLHRGHGMVNDLEGTSQIAPEAVAGNHDGAAHGLRTQYDGLAAMTLRCQAGGQVPSGAQTDFETGKAAYGQAIRLIRYHAARYR